MQLDLQYSRLIFFSEPLKVEMDLNLRQRNWEMC